MILKYSIGNDILSPGQRQRRQSPYQGGFQDPNIVDPSMPPPTQNFGNAQMQYTAPQYQQGQQQPGFQNFGQGTN